MRKAREILNGRQGTYRGRATLGFCFAGFSVGGVIINQDQIKIRPGQHFPPAKLAKCHHGKLAALHHAMPGGEFGSHMRQQRCNGGIRQGATRFARRIGVYGAFKRGSINVEFAFLHHAAGRFHGLFEIARFLHQRR